MSTTCFDGEIRIHVYRYRLVGKKCSSKAMRIILTPTNYDPLAVVSLYFSNGFNILLYGLGSKRNLIEDFRTTMLKDFSHVVVNGYFPSLTVKHVSITL